MEKRPESFYTVRFGDCDPFGHLNNARYLDYFLNAREDHLWDHYQLKLDEFAKDGIGWVVARHEIAYVRAALYNERVSIQSAIIELAESGLLVEMQMQDETRQSVKAILWSRFICINIKTGKKEQHPDSFMQLARQLIDTGVDVSKGLGGRLQSKSPVA